MTEATTKNRTVAQEAPPLRGVRAIAWNPEKDFRNNGMPVPQGAEMVRKYTFCYVDSEKSAASKASAEKTLGAAGVPFAVVFKELILNPGLNWVDAREWDAAVQASAERHKSDLEESKTTGKKLLPIHVDEIARLTEDRAIAVYQPNEKVISSGQFTGSLEDYPLPEIRRFAMEINDSKELSQFLDGVNDFDTKQVLKERLDTLEGGF